MNQSPLPRCAAAYLRVSTEEQLELSPESQLVEIQKYAQREGLRLLKEHIYIDPGISGKRAERRPAFLSMIAAAKEKNCPFSVILVWKFSRFARNQEESIFYKSILRSKCGVEVVSVTEPLIAGPFGALMERIIEWMDEFYSIRLSQEVKRSMTVNAHRGKLQCTAPFGYRAENGGLVIAEQEAAFVRLAFDRFLAGAGLLTIARELNALGGRTHRGNLFEGRTVSYLLRNPVYIGQLRWSTEGRRERLGADAGTIVAEGGHPPLVSRGVWEAAQKRFAEAEQRSISSHGNSNRSGHWLSGLVRCAACGSVLTFTPPRYYRCGGYVKGRCAVSQHIPAETLENALLDRLRQDMASAPSLSPQVTPSTSAVEQATLHRAALHTIHTREARLRDAYLSGVMPLEEYSEVREQLSQQRTELEAALSRLESAQQDAAPPLLDAAHHAEETLLPPDRSPEALRRAAEAVLEGCTLDRAGGVLTIVYRFSL